MNLNSCSRKHCQNPATKALALNVPAKDCPIAEHDPIRIILGLPLCDGCLAKCRAGEFLGQKIRDKPNPLRSIITQMTTGRRLAPPDFKRAFVSGVSFESEEYQALVRSR